MQPEKQIEMKPETELNDLPEYEPPKVITYRGKDILAAMGPAHACNSIGVISGAPDDFLKNDFLIIEP
jgi:hypothetical protein